jgi:hypothetical protein
VVAGRTAEGKGAAMLCSVFSDCLRSAQGAICGGQGSFVGSGNEDRGEVHHVVASAPEYGCRYVRVASKSKRGWEEARSCSGGCVLRRGSQPLFPGRGKELYVIRGVNSKDWLQAKIARFKDLRPSSVMESLEDAIEPAWILHIGRALATIKDLERRIVPPMSL